MSETGSAKEGGGHLPSAYLQMLERVRATLGEVEGRAGRRLQDWFAEAKDRAVELGELTREEAERVGDYLRRDLVDAAEYLSKTGGELKDWLRFDLDLVEDRLRELFAGMVDETRLELARLAEAARSADVLRKGEVAGFGTLRCMECGLEMEFKEPAGIPPCPRCGAGRFLRVSS